MPTYNTVTPPRTLPPILVYDKSATDFSSNGLRCLTPTVAEVEMELNKAPTLRMEHPIDDRGVWRDIKLSSIVCVPIRYRDQMRYQPMRVYSITKTRTGEKATILVEARHVYYDLNYEYIESFFGVYEDGSTAIQAAFNHAYEPDGSSVPMPHDNFTYDSDLSFVVVSVEKCSVTQALEIIAHRGGEGFGYLTQAELYVDGFYFSINHRMEGSLDDSFDIAVGINVQGISAKYSNDNRANGFAVTNGESFYISEPTSLEPLRLPYNKVVPLSPSYPDYVQNPVEEIVYFREFMDSKRELEVSYDISVVDMPNLDGYKDFRKIATLEVGDTGRITDEQFEISTNQKIIKKKYDAIKHLTVSIGLGNAKSSILG